MSKLTLAKLIDTYRADPISPYQKLRYRTRENTDSILRRLHTERGAVTIASIKGRDVMEWYDGWTSKGTEKIPMAHALIAQLRTLIGFGLAFLDDAQCARVSQVLRTLKFANGKPRTVHLTAVQADLIRHHARAAQLASVALAQAIQFECAFRQKDVIGEMVPRSEPGESKVMWRGQKWLRGLVWDEIDADLILTHVTSKRGKLAVHDLKLAPMVIDELARAYPGFVTGDTFDRSALPASGPVIVSEDSGRPWSTAKFRATWRSIARTAGIPDDVQNRDSRAGAITEATAGGASLEQAKELAGHSDVATTQIYSRDKIGKAREGQQARVAHRLKPG